MSTSFPNLNPNFEAYLTIWRIYSLNACLSKKIVKGNYNYFGECILEVLNMLESRIARLLRVSKYKREFIQNELGVSANTLSNWCTGKTYPTIDKAYRLAELLDVKVDDLYDYKEEK